MNKICKPIFKPIFHDVFQPVFKTEDEKSREELEKQIIEGCNSIATLERRVKIFGTTNNK